MNKFNQIKKVWLMTPLLLVSIFANAQVGKNNGVLNPNRASEKELMTIPHITEKIAEEIMEARPFLSISDLNRFLSPYFSEAQLKEIFIKCFVPINLNTASREEIMMVPGVGNRMAHEFEEYRPYIKLTQFRREIGKYVSDEDVARFEQYVFVPIDLNTASKEDILSIPGVGNRMLHEFEEYRPYKNMDHWRREIGKYVDDDELNRLQRYVKLN